MGLLDTFVKPTTRKVVIKCKYHDPVSLDELHSLQGKFKERTDADYARFCNSVDEFGFIAPFFIWIDTEGKMWTTDGHGRDIFLKRMRSEGVEMPDKFPAFEIEAENKIQAKKIILAFTSDYGKITQEGQYEFFNEPDSIIDPEEVEDYVSYDAYDKEFGEGDMEDTEPVPTKEKKEECAECTEYHANKHTI